LLKIKYFKLILLNQKRISKEKEFNRTSFPDLTGKMRGRKNEKRKIYFILQEKFDYSGKAGGAENEVFLFARFDADSDMTQSRRSP